MSLLLELLFGYFSVLCSSQAEVAYVIDYMHLLILFVSICTNQSTLCTISIINKAELVMSLTHVSATHV